MRLASAPTQTGNSPAAPADAGAATQPPRVGTRVFQNTLAQLVGRGVGLLFSAATSILLARFLGRERMGEYGAVYAYLALYTWIGTFGLEQILAREASQRRTEAASIFFMGPPSGAGSWAACGVKSIVSVANLVPRSSQLSVGQESSSLRFPLSPSTIETYGRTVVRLFNKGEREG